MSRSAKVLLKDGPWTGLEIRVRSAQSEYEADKRMSLPVKIGAHRGRYNLATGEWCPL